MPIKMTCPSCNESRRVNDRLAGRKVRCPSCEQPIRVPELRPNPELKSASAAKQSVGSKRDDASEAAHLGPPQSAEDLFDDADHSTLGGAGNHSAADLDPSPVMTSAGGHIGHREHEQKPESLAPIDVPRAAEMFPADDDDDDEADQVLVRSKKPEEEMDMTPMVDVTFLLLIFFMVTAAFSLQKSIQMPRQQTEAPSTNNVDEEDEVEAIEVEVDEFGSFLVLAQDWERETPGKTESDHRPPRSQRGKDRPDENSKLRFTKRPKSKFWSTRWMPEPSPITARSKSPKWNNST